MTTKDLAKKWKLYEKRWKLRDIYWNKIIRRRIFMKFFNTEPVMPRFAKRFVWSKKKANNYIADKIREGKPFFVARFGNTELQITNGVLKKKYKGETEETQKYLEEWFYVSMNYSGVFPSDISIAPRFADTILDAASEVDLLGFWHCYMEDFAIEEYIPDVKITHLFSLEPWLAKNPWSAALKGKKVLLIHPFEDTIINQYKKREQLFPGTEVLPEFELKTFKAIQTGGGGKDDRFKDWFEALEYMYEEVMKIDFDIAIIGCGAYGMPLGARIKRAGKQAIHLGGATQLMFGIKGKRWDDPKYPTKVCRLYNDAWIYPSDADRPSNAQAVEGGCYWK